MIPDFHDGYLDGLLVSEKQAAFFLRTVNGDKFTLVLFGVERLCAENFRQGNIILDLEFKEPAQADSESVQLAYGYEKGHPADFSMEKWAAEAKRLGLRVMEISASYGCTATAIFKEHELLAGYRV